MYGDLEENLSIIACPMVQNCGLYTYVFLGQMSKPHIYYIMCMFICAECGFAVCAIKCSEASH